MQVDDDGIFFVDYTLMMPCGKIPCVSGPFEGSATAAEFVVLLKGRYGPGELTKVGAPRKIPT